MSDRCPLGYLLKEGAILKLMGQNDPLQICPCKDDNGQPHGRVVKDTIFRALNHSPAQHCGFEPSSSDM